MSDPVGTVSPELLLWGKLKGRSETGAGFHPLICHMVDVAMVAGEMWSHVLPDAERACIAADLGLDEDLSATWVAFLAGLHDLGKACPVFQFRADAEVPHTSYPGLHPAPQGKGAHDAPHGVVTACTLPTLLDQQFGVARDVARRLATITGGHHGILPSATDVEGMNPQAVGRHGWETARAGLVSTLAEVLNVPSNRPPRTVGNAVAMMLAGLVSVADWIGSDEDCFPYQGNLNDLVAYSESAAQRARLALAKHGFTGSEQPDGQRSFVELFPKLEKPRPLQASVISLTEQVSSPSLVIIEAPMGEGKTEAALYLADYWGIRPGPRGLYVALPTQATSNQMFGRVRAYLEGRYVGETAQLQLLHGHASLSAQFQELKDNVGAQALEFGRIFDETGSGAVAAAEWFTYRKRGLLSSFGVGTVDQVLLAVLQTKHVFVRLFGLAHKVVIVDEVHAYDTYMSTLLERLLEWLAALGSPVALLSATLPVSRRDALLAAYRRGLTGETDTPDAGFDGLAHAAPYPRLSWVTGDAAGSCSFETSDLNRRTLHLAWVDGELPSEGGGSFALGERLRDALANGGCAAVICNTVRRAQDVYQALTPYFADHERDLLHARFLFKDRDEREKKALKNFGKDAGAERPYRMVLVATQVVEQSLDLDFDLMVTDLAPVDLVLQRAGRLHRHTRERPSGLETPTLWLRRVPDYSGIPQFDRGTTTVYDGHILLRSWLALHDRIRVAIPDEIEHLVESVYAKQPPPEDAPDALRQMWEATAQEQVAAARSESEQAKERWLNHPGFDGELWRFTRDPREEDAPNFHPAHQALTRLTPPSVSVVCLTPQERAAHDPSVKPNLHTARFLLERSVSLTDRRVVFALLGQPVPTGWQQSPLLRHTRLVELDADGRNSQIAGVSIQLHPDLGVRIISQERQ